MSLYTNFANKLIFPLHERLKGHHSVALKRELERSQWQSAEEIRAIQSQNLRSFMKKVYQGSSYYRQLLDDAGLHPDQIRDASDLARLPYLTKPLIREHTDGIATVPLASLKRFNTGGSTGEPLVFYMGKGRVSHDVAAKWRATRWWDVDIGDPELVVWGSPVELGAQDRVREWRDKLLRTQLLPAFEMSPENLDRFVAEIRACRPAMLFGYPSSLALIARHATETGHRLDDLGVRVVFVTSERLYDDQRATIEQAFACQVANGYGGRDAGFIAHQCPAGGMHLSAEHIIVEIVGPDGEVLPPGEAGEVVVTHLTTDEFPFIRYRTGDVAVLDDSVCSCGRGLPMLREIQGRTTDFIVASDGTIMHGLALIYILRDLDAVDSFKIIQESKQVLRVMIVSQQGLDETTRAGIVSGFRQRLGADVDVQLELVDDIAREKSGKFRYVVSKVAV